MCAKNTHACKTGQKMMDWRANLNDQSHVRTKNEIKWNIHANIYTDTKNEKKKKLNATPNGGNWKKKRKQKNWKWKKQTATMPANVAGMGALAGGVSGVPATAVPGGLQSASIASIELGKKRMRDSNDDLLMVPRLMHGVHFPSFSSRSWIPAKLARTLLVFLFFFSLSLSLSLFLLFFLLSLVTRSLLSYPRRLSSASLANGRVR